MENLDEGWETPGRVNTSRRKCKVRPALRNPRRYREPRKIETACASWPEQLEAAVEHDPKTKAR